jgi:undecaprenyl-diphosphatase
MTWIQSIVLALLQGVTELFPISSLGHSVVLTSLLGWGQLEASASFVPFLVLFHLGTAAALLVFFWRDWLVIIRALVVTAVAGRINADPYGRVAWLLVAGTVPAGLIGLFLQDPLKSLFATPLVAAAFLVINGGILLIGERARRRTLVASTSSTGETSKKGEVAHSARTVLEPIDKANVDPFTTLTLREAVLVGLAQALALIPGISRSGVTMVAALRVGLSHEDAAAYSFLLATPIIAAAGILEVPQLFAESGSTLAIAIVGGILAGVAAYVSVQFLMRYFENGRLDPFGYYCVVAGLASLVFLGIRG